MSFLGFLAQKTISLDIVTEIFTFYLYFHQCGWVEEEEKRGMVEFIERTIRRLSETLNGDNPVVEGVKKVRKRSEDFEKGS